MVGHLRDQSARIALGLLAVLGLLRDLDHANARQSPTRDNAVAVVEGVVRETFRSPRQGRTDVLVQIQVRRSELGKGQQPNGARVACPAPGDSVYVHTDSNARIPAELAEVRVYLSPRAQGGWEATSADWFDQTSDRPISRSPNDLPPATHESPGSTAPAGTTTGKTTVPGLGVTTETIEVRGHMAFRVLGLEHGGPAQRAGIEVGDIIAGVNGKPLTGVSQLDELSRQGRPLALVIVDINSGKAVQVEVSPAGLNPNSAPSIPTQTEPTPAPTAPRRTLGISTESINLGGRTALKVSAVKPDSPAAKAGLEVGDVLVGANGAAITGPEQLATALRKTGPNLTLLVRDVRTGKDTPVEVAFGGPATTIPPAIDIPALPGSGHRGAAPRTTDGSKADRLGAVTELSFYDVELALKVTEVEPGGPAALAGIQPGAIIVKADGKPMLHPNDLVETCRKAANSVKLTVADARNGRTTDVEVDLRGR